ncbi:hypothetical protein RRG08_040356 [Elysia crispata]|uniref:Uncharacterized protein n=1 Tax=Elysia crispata TaxID=231223 RepID=A0AAE1D3W5_9GAST|nr:hypothetical protein RRG08_040356 [Elysia crispata]
MPVARVSKEIKITAAIRGGRWRAQVYGVWSLKYVSGTDYVRSRYVHHTFLRNARAGLARSWYVHHTFLRNARAGLARSWYVHHTFLRNARAGLARSWCKESDIVDKENSQRYVL